jgi:hypothetical protein
VFAGPAWRKKLKEHAHETGVFDVVVQGFTGTPARIVEEAQ